MDAIDQRGRAAALGPSVFLYKSTRDSEQDQPVPAGHEVDGLIIVRDDGTCTVAMGTRLGNL